MADFKLHDILLMGHQTWAITAINDEFMELKTVEPNAQGYHKVNKVMLADAWKWGIYELHRIDTELREYIPNKMIEDLLA